MARGNAAYVYEMTDLQHIEMAEFILSKQSMFVISGYENDLYKKLFRKWTVVKNKTFADGAVERTELLYLSPKCR